MTDQVDTSLITSEADRERFIFGGKAVFTIVSKKTGTRFTYKVKGYPAKKLSFVSVLNGPDNWENYMYIGLIWNDRNRGLRAGNKGHGDAPSFKALAWLLYHLDSDKVELWTEGKCCRCNRRLTDPKSIALGIGPECIKHFSF
jgi:hypothetical protein